MTHVQVFERFNHIEPVREHTSECSYCRRPGNMGRFSYTTYAHRLDVNSYECLLESGFMRSGHTLYLPSNEKTCCPNIPIRLDALRFKPKHDQLRALRRVADVLSGARELTLPERNTDVFLACMRLTAEGREAEAAEITCKYRDSCVTGDERASIAQKANAVGMHFLDDRAGSCLEQHQEDEEGEVEGGKARGEAGATEVRFASSSVSLLAHVHRHIGSVPVLHPSRAMLPDHDCMDMDTDQVAEGVTALLARLPRDALLRMHTAFSLAPTIQSYLQALTDVTQTSTIAGSANPADSWSLSTDAAALARFRIMMEAPAVSARAHTNKRTRADASASGVNVTHAPDVVCNAAFVITGLAATGTGEELRGLQRVQLQQRVASELAASICTRGGAASTFAVEPSLPLAHIDAHAAGIGYLNIDVYLGAAQGGDVDENADVLRLRASLVHPLVDDILARRTALRQSAACAPSRAHADESLAALLARIPASLNTCTARSAAEREALRVHACTIQSAREEAGMRAFKAESRERAVRVARDELAMPLDEGDVSSSDSGESEGEWEERVGQWERDMQSWTVSSIDISGSGGEPCERAPPLHPLRRLRATRSAKLATARAAQLSRRKAEESADLAAEIAASEGVLRELAAAGIGAAASRLRMRAEEGRVRGAGGQAEADAGPPTPLLPFGPGPHSLTVTLTLPTYSPEAHELYARFNMALHRGRPAGQSRTHYESHLVASPLLGMPGWALAWDARALEGEGEGGHGGAGGGSLPTLTPWEDECDRLGLTLGQEGLCADPATAIIIAHEGQAQVEGEGGYDETDNEEEEEGEGHMAVDEDTDGGDSSNQKRPCKAKARMMWRWVMDTLVDTCNDALACPPVPTPTPASVKAVRYERMRARSACARASLHCSDPPPSSSPPLLPSALTSLAAPLLSYLASLPSLDLTPASVLLGVYHLAGQLIQEGREGERALVDWTREMERVAEENGRVSEEWARDEREGGMGSEGGGQGPQCSPQPPPPALPALSPAWLNPHRLGDRLHALLHTHAASLRWLEGAVQERAKVAAQVVRGTENEHAEPHVQPCAIDERYFARAYTPGSVRMGAYPLPVPSTRPPAPGPFIHVSGWDLPFGYGTFHHAYRLDGTLVAVSVLDILPGRVASVYFFYDPDLREGLQLGKLSALVETWLVREIAAFGLAHPEFVTGAVGQARTPPPMRYLDMNYYVHTCRAMAYKRRFHPSEVLCPVVRHGAWMPLSPSVLACMDGDPCAALARGREECLPSLMAMGVHVPEEWKEDPHRFQEELARTLAAALDDLDKAQTRSVHLRDNVLVQLSPEHAARQIPFSGLNTRSRDMCGPGLGVWLDHARPSIARRTVLDVHSLAAVGWAAGTLREEVEGRRMSREQGKRERQVRRAKKGGRLEAGQHEHGQERALDA